MCAPTEMSGSVKLKIRLITIRPPMPDSHHADPARAQLDDRRAHQAEDRPEAPRLGASVASSAPKEPASSDVK